MRLLYRADGGHPIGTGHIYRAVRVLRRLSGMCDVQAVLAVGENGAAQSIAAGAPAELALVNPSFGPESVKPRFTFNSISAILADRMFDVIAVDMLDTTTDEMVQLRASGAHVISFDDRGEGRKQADALINVLVTDPSPKSLTAQTKLYEGTEYAVLDPIFEIRHGAFRMREVADNRVFVSLGGGDAAGLSLKVARALRIVRTITRVEFGVGPAFPHRKELDDELKSAAWESKIFVNLPTLVDRYLSCDLAIVAGGLTMYEVCCVGAPALAVCQSIDHQLELSERLSDAGAMATAGYGELASERQIADAAEKLLGDKACRAAMSQAGPRLVDGKGAERVGQILLASEGGND